MLSIQRLREMLAYDPETGVFTKLIHWKVPSNAGIKAGHPDSYGYLQIVIDGKTYLAHRLAWFYVHGDWPKQQIDHINGIKTDNRIVNLRDVDGSTNMQNMRVKRSGCASRFLGVCRCPYTGRWFSAISINGRKKRLGTFDTEEEAYGVYLSAKRAHHKGCTI